MSRGNLYVLFPNGDVRYGIYNGTSDTAGRPLQPTPEFTWEEWRGVGPWRDPYALVEGDDEPVVIASDYGGGFSWEGRATREYLTRGASPHGIENWNGDFDPGSEPAANYEKGLPNWATYPPPITIELAKLELGDRVRKALT